MPNDLSASNLHRRKEDGSHDSICLDCLATIPKLAAKDGLEKVSSAHVCAFPFDSVRSALRG